MRNRTAEQQKEYDDMLAEMETRRGSRTPEEQASLDLMDKQETLEKT